MSEDTEETSERKPQDDSGKDALETARKRFTHAADGAADNHTNYIEDVKFGRLGDQWPEAIANERKKDSRPCLTINRMPSFIRQVSNDARQNRPSIRVRPVDSNADVKTADTINGLFRNIESISYADVAYDTAIDNSLSGGFGYIRLDVDYAHNDTFDMDILINPVPNPLNVYGDPMSQAFDSLAWRYAFIIDVMAKTDFEAEYPGAQAGDFDGDSDDYPWFTEDTVRVAEYFDRFEVAKKILLLSDRSIVEPDVFEKNRALYDAMGVTVKTDRDIKSWKVIHRLMTGAEVLSETPWAGQYIPIAPVYGEVVNLEGKQHLRSLIRDSKDPQRQFNYWRSAATETVALAPKAPFIGPEEAFAGKDKAKWGLANQKAYSYISYKGATAPQRQGPSTMPAADLQLALNAADDMKSVMGIYDASLGARSNETSGRAIRERKMEGDVSTFHFIDNLTRAIRCVGVIALDLIPHVYNTERIIRVLGEDGKADAVALMKAPDGSNLPVFDLTKGKYDLVVTSGPSYTTRRQEAAEQMIEMGRSVPQLFEVAGDLIAKNLDWPGADKLAERLKKALPPQFQEPAVGPDGQPVPPPEPQPDPAVVAAQQQAALDLQTAQAKAASDIKIAQDKNSANIQAMQAESAARIQIMREEAAVQAEIDRDRARVDGAVRVSAQVAKNNQPSPQA